MATRTPLTWLVTFAGIAAFGRQTMAADDAERFREFCAKAAPGESLAVTGQEGWLFLRSELRHIGVGSFWGANAAQVSKASSPTKADPLPAIVDFHEQLASRGIKLIVAPVPCKALIYPEKLTTASATRLDTVHQQFYKILAEKGVQVLDLTEVFLTEKARPDSSLTYCKTDTHWSPFGCEVTARELKKLLGSPAWLSGKPDAFLAKSQVRRIVGDLTDGKGGEDLPARVVQGPAAALEDRASPIVLLGDSHTLVFHAGAELHGTGAGLADQLAAELGAAVDVIGVRGSGATPARVNLLQRMKADPDYLSRKKVVIWCFAAREFTESAGWLVFRLAK